MSEGIRRKWFESRGLDPDELLPTWVYHHGEYHSVLMPRWRPACTSPREIDMGAFRRAFDYEAGKHQAYRREPASGEVVPFRPRRRPHCDHQATGK